MLLREYHEDIEYDLLTLPSPVDLLDLYRGALSPRRLWVILRGLPSSSRFKRALDPRASVDAEWTPATYLLAELLDFSHGVNAGKRLIGAYPRPGDAQRKEVEQQERLRRLLEQQERNRQREIAENGGVTDG